MQNTTTLNNSDRILLLPKDYSRVWNGEDLYSEMYHADGRRDIQMYQNLAERSVGNIVISHIDQCDAMPFGDKDALIKEIHETLDDNQGLIEVECGTNPRGYEYVYSIIKIYHREEQTSVYCMRMHIKNGEELIEVSGSFFEAFVTNERGSVALSMAWNAELEIEPGSVFPVGWNQDPYDPNYTNWIPMIMAEKRSFDGLFPGDPLSQARELVLALTEDSYYKTCEEIEKENEPEKKINSMAQLFSGEVIRGGSYKVDIIENDQKDDNYERPERRRFPFRPSDIADAAAKAAGDVVSAVKRTSAELDKVKVPFEVPDDFRNKLNQPIKEIPGWGKRKYIGFGKSTYGVNALLITWPVLDSQSMSLTDRNSIIENIRTEDAPNQGLIDVKCGITPKGNRYAYVIRKIYFTDEEDNRNSSTQYTLGLNIRIDGKVHFIDSSFGPSEDFGDIRRSALSIMQCGSRALMLEADEWNHDPFDENIEDGFLMDWTEDEKYDDLFPYSPLSELRGFVKYVTENN